MENIFSLLTAVSQDLSDMKVRIAAAVVYRGKVVSVGVNQMKSHPFQARWSKNEHAIFFHAETNAIFHARKKLSDDELAKSTLFVIRTKRLLKVDEIVYGMAKPCCGCQSCIDHYGIRKVIYTLDCKTKDEKRFVTVEKGG